MSLDDLSIVYQQYIRATFSNSYFPTVSGAAVAAVVECPGVQDPFPPDPRFAGQTVLLP
jgi:hypothetical protein